MKRQAEQGSVHVVIIGILVCIILGLVGVLFWQNFIMKKDTTQPLADSPLKATQTATPTPKKDSVTESKQGIDKAMNTPAYTGLVDYMAPSVDGAIAYSDAIFQGQTGATVAASVHQYFSDFAKNNNQTAVTGWKLEDYDTSTNANLKKMGAETTFYDFKGSYVAVGDTAATANLFVSFRLNEQGKITYVFYGLMQ